MVQAQYKATLRKNLGFVRANRFRSLHPVLYFWILFSILAGSFFGLFLLNLRFAAGNHSLAVIFETISTPGWYDVSETLNAQVSSAVWQACAVSIGSMGLGVAGLITQALVKNPLADASTLGITQAAVFGIVAIVSNGIVSYGAQYGMALAAGAAAVGLLFLMLLVSRGRISGYRIILAGLALGIVFKTLTFFFRGGNDLANVLNFAYILGGAEEIYHNNFAEPWTVLLISMVLIVAGAAVALLNSKNLTTMELGEGKARDLGVNVVTTRVLSIISLILVTPAAVIIVGNISFIGLFAAHFARYVMGTRNYLYTMPLCIFFAMFLGSAGMQLTERAPAINSGLWMTFIGVPYLIYIAIKGVR